MPEISEIQELVLKEAQTVENMIVQDLDLKQTQEHISLFKVQMKKSQRAMTSSLMSLICRLINS